MALGTISSTVKIPESNITNDNSGNLATVIGADTSATTIPPAKVSGLGVSQGLTAGGLVKSGVVSGLSGAAAGVVTSAVAFGAAFPTALDQVELTIRVPSAQGIGFGGIWTTAEAAGGFTINADIVTAVAASTFEVGWVAYGH